LKCQYCGAEEPLPFKCPFCGGYFCAQHRLPESHECPELWKAWIHRRRLESWEPEVAREESIRGVDSFRRVLYPETKVFWFSYEEIKHILVGTILVMAVGLSIFLTPYNIVIVSKRLSLPLISSLAIVFSSIFILHEIAHKAVAQYYGLWAEFRLNTLGAMITLFSIFTPIKLVSPGAVVVVGEAHRETLGKTALAGPLTNIGLSILFFLWFIFSKSKPALIGAVYSPWIALFNLIPFGVFDGAKILWWNKKVWVASFITSLILTAVAMILL